jgi:hypothetical protein
MDKYGASWRHSGNVNLHWSASLASSAAMASTNCWTFTLWPLPASDEVSPEYAAGSGSDSAATRRAQFRVPYWVPLNAWLSSGISVSS